LIRKKVGQAKPDGVTNDSVQSLAMAAKKLGREEFFKKSRLGAFVKLFEPGFLKNPLRTLRPLREAIFQLNCSG
jgi:hypothetical protein